MLALRDPREAYRRVEVDARVQGASQGELVVVCMDEVVMALGSAMLADARGNNTLKSRSLTRAISALFALEMGVQADNPMAGVLLQLFQSARHTVLASVAAFEPERIRDIRADFREVGQAFRIAFTQAHARPSLKPI